jgi:hypothetical protein
MVLAPPSQSNAASVYQREPDTMSATQTTAHTMPATASKADLMAASIGDTLTAANGSVWTKSSATHTSSSRWTDEGGRWHTSNQLASRLAWWAQTAAADAAERAQVDANVASGAQGTCTACGLVGSHDGSSYCCTAPVVEVLAEQAAAAAAAELEAAMAAESAAYDAAELEASSAAVEAELEAARAITPESYPAGTRVISSTLPAQAGTVLGWVRDTITVAWDGGATTSSPASFKGLRYEPQAAPEGPVSLCAFPDCIHHLSA